MLLHYILFQHEQHRTLLLVG